MDRFLMAVLITGALFAGMTWLLHRYILYSLAKYLPGILAFLFSIYQIVMARISPAGFEGLIRGIYAVLFLAGALFGIATAVILDIKAKKKG